LFGCCENAKEREELESWSLFIDLGAEGTKNALT
jgi:hypothetical protein